MLKEKMLPNPKNQIKIHSSRTIEDLCNLPFSSIQAVKGSRRDIDELNAAIEIKIKKIDEKMLPKGSE